MRTCGEWSDVGDVWIRSGYEKEIAARLWVDDRDDGCMAYQTVMAGPVFFFESGTCYFWLATTPLFSRKACNDS